MPIAIFQRAWPWRALVSGGVLLIICGCQPSGPKSLLLGAKSIEEKDYPRALKHLEAATELMPTHPQVWNHLGLAWHNSREPEKAAEAYGRALKIDPQLPSAHYNLGVLYLEQGRVNEAIGALGTFVSLQPTNALGHSKLGAALVQARRIDEAERVLMQALRLNSRDAEAHNHLGMIHAQRKRGRDAMLEFNAALEDRPNYPAALLNQAIVAQMYFGRTELAIERYRAYLSLSKDRRLEPEISGIIRRLEEANRPPVAPVVAETNRFNIPPATNAVAAEVSPAPRTNEVATNVAVWRPPARTNELATVATPLALPKTNAIPARVEPTNVVRTAQAPPPTPPATSTVARNIPPEEVEEPPPAVEVEVVSEPDFRPPRDIPTNNREVQIAAARPAGQESPLIIPRKDRPQEERRTMLDRANPLRWFRSEQPENAPPPRPPVQAPRYQPPETEAQAQARRIPPQFERYPYQKSAPVSGDRPQAERLFVQGARAHQAQRLSEAVDFYRQAVRADPTYFDAQYNLGLAALQLKDLPLALQANENARLLRPTSIESRYHFAISLRDANYPVDAATELRELLAEAPNETRAHLALANLYAQRLDEPALAQRHYQRLLELVPNHPDATAIRHWLAARR